MSLSRLSGSGLQCSAARIFASACAWICAPAAGSARGTQDDAPPPQAPAADARNWTVENYGITLQTWRCAADRICLRVHDIDPAHPKNRELMARLRNYSRSERHGIFTRSVPDTSRVTARDFNQYCGHAPAMRVTRRNDTEWRGLVRSPFNGKDYGLEMSIRRDGRLHIAGYLPALPLLRMGVAATPAPAAPPRHCPAPRQG